MKNPRDSLINKIRNEKKFLHRRFWFSWILTSLVTVIIPVFILAVFDKFWPVRENTAFYLLVLFFFPSLFFVLKKFFDFRKRLPDEKKIVLMIEDLCPELMDSLICSLELLWLKTDRMNSLNHRLVQATDKAIDEETIHSKIKQKAPKFRRFLLLGSMLAAVLFVLYLFPYVNKAYAHSLDLVSRETSGLIVSPGHIEIALGGDLEIQVQVLRGPSQAEITISSSEENITYEMYNQPDGQFVYKTFSVNAGFRYFISTPTLKSKIYEVTTYTKPIISECEIKIIPPEYTQIPTSILTKLEDFSVPQGSFLRFLIKTNLPVAAELVLEEMDRIPLGLHESLEYVGNLQVNSNLTFTIEMEDEYGHLESTERKYAIESIADFGPLLQPVTPEENASRDKEDETSFSFKVTDDYGIQSVKLFYSISGSELQEEEIYVGGEDHTAKEKLVAHTLKFSGKVKDGDVISYFGAASDYAIPEPNFGYSDVRFIEIRPEKPEPDDEKKGGGGEMKKLSVSDLIIEQKQLIRSTWTLDRLKAVTDREEMIRDLAILAADLHIESKRRLAKLKGISNEVPKKEEELEQAKPKVPNLPLIDSPDLNLQDSIGKSPINKLKTPHSLSQGLETNTSKPNSPQLDNNEGENIPNEAPKNDLVSQLFKEALQNSEKKESHPEPSLGLVGKYFEEAIRNMSRSENFLKKKLPEESLPHQQRSLSKLISIEIELEKNSSAASSEGEEGEGESKEKQEMEEKESKKKKQEAIALLKKITSALEMLVQRQDNLNYEISRIKTASDKEVRDHLEKKQDKIQDETKDLTRDLNQLREAASASKELGEAIRNMGKVTSKLTANQTVNARKHGELASQFLNRGKELLEELNENLMGDKLGKADKALQAIRKKQRDLIDKTGNLANGKNKGESPSEIMGGQKANRNSFDRLMKDLENLANEMEDSSPAVSRELGKALNTAQKKNISGKMKRSENALKYGQFERAMDYQKVSEEALGQLSEIMQNAMDQRESLSSAELSQMLQSILKDANRLQKAQQKQNSASQNKELYKEINKNLADITERLKDKEMEKLSESLSSLVLAKAGSSKNLDQPLLELLYQSAGVLEKKLIQKTLKKKISLSRIGGQKPPDEYKKLVNEYFKNLSKLN